jgi:hypothetical protein
MKTNLARRHGLSAVVILLLAVLAVGSTDTDKVRSSGSSTTGGQNSNEPPVESAPQWNYDVEADPMGGTTSLAYIESANTVEFKFPYAGPQHAKLMLRSHPRYGKDVILKIERGQFLCPSYEDCTALVRFDDGPAQTFTAAGSADNSTETVFLRNYSRFLASMMKAKRVRISCRVYQEGSPVFEFDVSGFEIGRYKPAR